MATLAPAAHTVFAPSAVVTSIATVVSQASVTSLAGVIVTLAAYTTLVYLWSHNNAHKWFTPGQLTKTFIAGLTLFASLRISGGTDLLRWLIITSGVVTVTVVWLSPAHAGFTVTGLALEGLSLVGVLPGNPYQWVTTDANILVAYAVVALPAVVGGRIVATGRVLDRVRPAPASPSPMERRMNGLDPTVTEWVLSYLFGRAYLAVRWDMSEQELDRRDWRVQSPELSRVERLNEAPAAEWNGGALPIDSSASSSEGTTGGNSNSQTEEEEETGSNNDLDNRTQPGRRSDPTPEVQAETPDPSEEVDSKTTPPTTNEEMNADQLQFPWEQAPDTRFDDIGGYDEVKEDLQKSVVEPLRTSSSAFDRFNVDPARGILLHGPPGTGKTMFGRAIANELNRPFLKVTQADVASKWVNEGPERVKQMFEEAQGVGGVVLIDEAEILVGDRNGSLSSNEETRKVTTQFLAQLTQEHKRFVVILTTNEVELIDDAIRRPGRIDKEFEIGLPDADTRAKILAIKLADVPHSVSEQDCTQLTKELDGWSGAELEQVVTQAKTKAAHDHATRLTPRHLEEAIDDVARSR